MTEYLGGFVLVVSVDGVLLNNRRMISCFYLWMVSNAVSACIHGHTELWMLCARDMIFFCLCIESLRRWRITRTK